MGLAAPARSKTAAAKLETRETEGNAAKKDSSSTVSFTKKKGHELFASLVCLPILSGRWLAARPPQTTLVGALAHPPGGLHNGVEAHVLLLDQTPNES